MRLLSVHVVRLRMRGPRSCLSSVNKQRLCRQEPLSLAPFKLSPPSEVSADDGNESPPSGVELSPRHRWVEVSWGESSYTASASGILRCFFFPWKVPPKKNFKIPSPWAGVNFCLDKMQLLKCFRLFSVISSDRMNASVFQPRRLPFQLPSWTRLAK